MWKQRKRQRCSRGPCCNGVQDLLRHFSKESGGCDCLSGFFFFFSRLIVCFVCLKRAALSSHWEEAQCTESTRLPCFGSSKNGRGFTSPQPLKRPLGAWCEEPCLGQGLRVLSHVRIFVPTGHPSGGRIQGWQSMEVFWKTGQDLDQRNEIWVKTRWMN